MCANIESVQKYQQITLTKYNDCKSGCPILAETDFLIKLDRLRKQARGLHVITILSFSLTLKWTLQKSKYRKEIYNEEILMIV